MGWQDLALLGVPNCNVRLPVHPRLLISRIEVTSVHRLCRCLWAVTPQCYPDKLSVVSVLSQYEMTKQLAPQRFARAIAAISLALACVILGAAIGLMSASLLTPKDAMGWDGIADALGGLMVGGVLGLVAGGYLASGLSVRARWWSAAVALVLAAGTLWSLALTAN